jgi:hypothetical protein
MSIIKLGHASSIEITIPYVKSYNYKEGAEQAAYQCLDQILIIQANHWVLEETMDGPEAYINFGVEEEATTAAVAVNSPPPHGSEGRCIQSRGLAKPTTTREA